MSQHGYPGRVSRAHMDGKACAEPRTIEVLVETLTGTAFEMTVSPLDTVLAIKSKIFRVEGIPISQQHLLYNLQELDNSSSLQDHCIDDGATLRLVLSMRGGPISMHRLPLPAGDDVHWREIKELVESDRCESGEWSSGSRVTVLVFRDGDNVNMLRVRQNEDGTYSPLADTHNLNSSSSLKNLLLESCEDGCGSVQENAVTMSKMLELRRRMESLSVQRSHRLASHDQESADSKLIQKTRSEETLSTTEGLFEEADTLQFESRSLSQFVGEDDTFSPLYDGNYTRYDYDCSFADRYTLLPPITADCEQSGDEVSTERRERIKLSDALAGSILVKSAGPGGRRDDDDAILEEGLCVGGAGLDECVAPDSHLAKKLLAHAPIPAAEYGALVGGEAAAGTWRVRRAFGSSSQLAPPAPLAPAHSASNLHVRPPHRHPSSSVFSSSTSDLEKLKRNRFLPALCRHRNREHLDLSDERLDRDDARKPARNLEVGSERRHRRIKKIAELERAEASAFRSDDVGYESSIRKLPNDGLARVQPRPVDTPPGDTDEPHKADPSKKIARVRCGLCRKRLSIATVHKCRCGAEFCAPHRYAEVHGCAYDYKAHAHQYLQRANPLVSAPKLPKI